VSPKFNSPTFDLSYDQDNQDVESQQNVDHNMLDQAQSMTDRSGDDITRDSSDVATVTRTHDFRNVRRTLSGALEVGGVLGVSVVARSSPHMQRRHHPNQEHPNQECKD